jgi:hypothetical protein
MRWRAGSRHRLVAIDTLSRSQETRHAQWPVQSDRILRCRYTGGSCSRNSCRQLPRLLDHRATVSSLFKGHKVRPCLTQEKLLVPRFCPSTFVSCASTPFSGDCLHMIGRASALRYGTGSPAMSLSTLPLEEGLRRRTFCLMRKSSPAQKSDRGPL